MSTFNTGGQRYRKVHGRAIGYQYGHPDAFGVPGSPTTINEVYGDGLSITYGMPRQHVWTYVAAVSEGILNANTDSNCPCSDYPGVSPPSYIGDNWYCESGNLIQGHQTCFLMIHSGMVRIARERAVAMVNLLHGSVSSYLDQL